MAADEPAFIEEFRSSIVVMTAGTAVMHQQKPSGKLFTRYAGWAFRYKTLSDGRRQILNFLLPGNSIGLQRLAEYYDAPLRQVLLL